MPVRQFLTGIGYLGRGLAMYATNPGLLALGIIPALITSALLIIVVIALLIYFIGDLSAAVTWFADGWSAWERDSIRVIAGVSIIGLTGLLAIVTFTSVTLAIGDPFYEKISARVEDRLGGVPNAVDLPFLAELRRGIV